MLSATHQQFPDRSGATTLFVTPSSTPSREPHYLVSLFQVRLKLPGLCAALVSAEAGHSLDLPRHIRGFGAVLAVILVEQCQLVAARRGHHAVPTLTQARWRSQHALQGGLPPEPHLPAHTFKPPLKVFARSSRWPGQLSVFEGNLLSTAQRGSQAQAQARPLGSQASKPPRGCQSLACSRSRGALASGMNAPEPPSCSCSSRGLGNAQPPRCAAFAHMCQPRHSLSVLLSVSFRKSGLCDMLPAYSSITAIWRDWRASTSASCGCGAGCTDMCGAGGRSGTGVQRCEALVCPASEVICYS